MKHRGALVNAYLKKKNTGGLFGKEEVTTVEPIQNVVEEAPPIKSKKFNASKIAAVSGLASGLIDAVDPGDNFGVQSTGGAALKGVASGAAAGAVAGPIGMGVGAVVGGVTSVIGNDKKIANKRRVIAGREAKHKENAEAAVARRIALDPRIQGDPEASMYKLGGTIKGIPAGKFTVGKSLVSGFRQIKSPMPTVAVNPNKMEGGGVIPSVDGRGEVVGPSHEEGGVKMPQLGVELEGGETIDNEFVFSEELGFAKRHKPIIKAIDTASKDDSPLAKKTVKLLEAQEEALKIKQEKTKQELGLENEIDNTTTMGESNKMQNGGRILASGMRSFKNKKTWRPGLRGEKTRQDAANEEFMEMVSTSAVPLPKKVKTNNLGGVQTSTVYSQDKKGVWRDPSGMVKEFKKSKNSASRSTSVNDSIPVQTKKKGLPSTADPSSIYIEEDTQEPAVPFKSNYPMNISKGLPDVVKGKPYVSTTPQPKALKGGVPKGELLTPQNTTRTVLNIGTLAGGRGPIVDPEAIPSEADYRKPASTPSTSTSPRTGGGGGGTTPKKAGTTATATSPTVTPEVRVTQTLAGIPTEGLAERYKRDLTEGSKVLPGLAEAKERISPTPNPKTGSSADNSTNDKFGIEDALPFASNLLNSFRKLPNVPEPILTDQVSPRYINLQASRNEATRQVRSANKLAERQLSSSGNAQAVAAANLASGIRAVSGINETENNANAQIAARADETNLQIRRENNSKLEFKNNQDVSRQLKQQELNSENVANFADKVQLRQRDNKLLALEDDKLLLNLAEDNTGASWRAGKAIFRRRLTPSAFKELETQMEATEKMNKEEREIRIAYLLKGVGEAVKQDANNPSVLVTSAKKKQK